MHDGFLKVAAGTPEVRVADCIDNAQRCLELIQEGAAQGVKVLCLPELCLTGCTCGDLFLQSTLLCAAEEALKTILTATEEVDMLIALGLPVRYNHKLFNCAAVMCRGRLLGLVPKSGLSNSTEVEETRWFSSGRDLLGTACSIPFAGQESVDISPGLLFRCASLPLLTVGVTLCGDLWAAGDSAARLAQGGAVLLLAPAASNETVGRADNRCTLLCAASARLLCGYVYAGAGWGESSTDRVYAGHRILAENGAILAQRRFETGLTIAEMDLERLSRQRQRTSRYPSDADSRCPNDFSLDVAETALTRPVEKNPFVPADAEARDIRCREILIIAALGLKQRLAHTAVKTVVLGLSGGLDSTLALLLTVRALDLLGRPRTDLLAVTMPCFGTTQRTRSNAEGLAQQMGVTLRTIDIGPAVTRHFQDIGHDPEDRSITFENGQARERTQVLMDLANQTGGLVVGTGNLSELALGWATYNGDHMSMYAVNAGIPKTLVRHLVEYEARAVQNQDPQLAHVLRDILATPVSPELLPPKAGEITQKTEDLVGPYELHDFFLYYVVRWGFSPRKILRLACYAFGKTYDRDVILHWLKTFYRRFFSQQFKRSCLPDSPKVGSVTLSPRGDWRMPSDASVRVWLEEIDRLG